MVKETEKIRRKAPSQASLDPFDRRILSALIADAGQSYARLGAQVGLSAPAVHERVKRLRAAGTLTGVSARVDGPSVGKPLLAFVHVDLTGWGKSQRLFGIADFPEVEEMHSVAGDTSVILKVRTGSTDGLEHLLAQLYAIPGVTATRSYVVLSTYLERPVQATMTDVWPALPPTTVEAGR